MDAEATLAWLGDDVGAKVARAWLARQRGLRSTGAPAAEGGQPKAKANGTPKTSAEWARYWSGR
jgi:hypothetical protein